MCEHLQAHEPLHVQQTALMCAAPKHQFEQISCVQCVPILLRPLHTWLSASIRWANAPVAVCVARTIGETTTSSTLRSFVC